jgi:hypothetical protein
MGNADQVGSPARSALAPGARKAAQPTARNQNDLKVLDGQITISD